jgi:hypothetical protein
MGLDRRFEIVARAAELFPLHKELLNLAEAFETVKFPEQSSLVML